jgi:spore germination protein KC
MNRKKDYKSSKRMILILIMLISSVILTSCWNYREINDVDIIVGVGIDWDSKNNKYILTYEVISVEPGVGRGRMQSRTIQNTGDTLFGGIRKFAEKNGKVAYWAHTKVMIISRDTAEKGIVPMLDYTMRDAEFRPDMNILISDENTASQILTLKQGMKISSFKLEESLKVQHKVGSFENVDLWNFTDKLSREGFSPVAPIVYLEKRGEKIVPKVSGTAVFKEDKMIGILGGDETKYYLFIDDEIRNQPLDIKYQVDSEDLNVSLEILKNNTKVKPINKGGKLVMSINIETDVAIAEIGGTKNIIEEKARGELEKNIEKYIKRNVIRLINRVQDEYNSDIFGFGNTIKKQMPKEWKKIGKEWDEYFPKLKVEVNTKVNITKSALTSEPIKIGE